MIFNLHSLIDKYKIKIDNIIHIGGHVGTEIDLYKNINNECAVQIFEPTPETYKQLLEVASKHDNIYAHNVALGDVECIMELHIDCASKMSNSLLKPKIHIIQYPHIKFEEVINVPVKTLDSYNLDSSYNFLNIDVQGFEDRVLRGGINTLKNIHYIIIEVNNQELYETGVLFNDLNAFLVAQGFECKELDWAGDTWGDAFYLRVENTTT